MTSQEKSKVSDIVKLNIGGIRYWTTKTTLLSKGNPDRPSFFTAIFSGNYADTRDDDGFIFIDRNGKLFEPILDYLRTGQWMVPVMFDEKQLLAEARYYGIEPDVYTTFTDEYLFQRIDENQRLQEDKVAKRNAELWESILQAVIAKFSEQLEKNRGVLRLYIVESLDDIRILLNQNGAARKIEKEINTFLTSPEVVVNTLYYSCLRTSSNIFSKYVLTEHKLTLYVKGVGAYCSEGSLVICDLEEATAKGLEDILFDATYLEWSKEKVLVNRRFSLTSSN